MFSFDLFYFFRREKKLSRREIIFSRPEIYFSRRENNLSRRESLNQYREIDYLKQGKQERKGDNCHFDSAT